nr:Rha family transcriptional regulator [Mitsuokella multacida]
MSDLQKLPPTLDSREVAEMVDKTHAHLCRDIAGYIEVMSKNPKLVSSNFFIERTYKQAGNGKEVKRYDITKKGCEMVANKLTGEKGILFTAEYVERFNKMEQEQKPMTELEILQGSINQLVEQNKRLSRVEMKQEEQDRQMSHINTSIEVLNGVCTEGTKRDRLNAMVRAYANKAGLTYPTAWHKFCEAFNFAFHTNIGLLITNYMKKQAINKKMSTPVYLEAAERLDDALRVAEKMLNSLPGKVARA